MTKSRDSSSIINLKDKATQLDLRDVLLNLCYPAPAATSAFTVDLAKIPAGKFLNTLSVPELWQAANTFLKRGEYDLATKYYQRIFKLEPNQAKVLALWGFALVLDGKIRQGIKLLSQAILQDKTLDEAHVWLAYAQIISGGFRSAIKRLKRLKSYYEQNPDNDEIILLTRSTLLLGIAYLADDRPQDAEKELRLSHNYQPLHQTCYLLACIGFSKGAKLFLQQKFSKALPIWVEYSELSIDCNGSSAWHGTSEIAQFFARLSTLPEYHKQLDASNKKIKKSERGISYWHTALVLAGLNLLPEFYEEESNIENSEELWRKKAKDNPKYPYAQFRHVICLLYLGKLDKAYDEILHVRDKLPASKLSFFKIDELIDWISSARDTRSRKRTVHVVYSKEDETAWTRNKFTPQEINDWRKEGFALEEAISWRSKNINNPVTALRWKKLGASSEEVAYWLEHFPVSEAALPYYASGFRDPIQAVKWSRHFTIPAQAWDCYTRGERLPEEEIQC